MLVSDGQYRVEDLCTAQPHVLFLVFLLISDLPKHIITAYQTYLPPGREQVRDERPVLPNFTS